MLGFMVLFSPRCELFLHKFLVKMIFFDSGVSSVFILRMVLQETYELLDCMFYDDGVTGNPSWSNTYYATVTRQSTDSVITATSSTSDGNVRIDGFNGDYCIEFDFKSNGGVYPQFRYDTTVRGRIYWSSYEDGDYHHCSLTIKDNIVTGTIDGNSIAPQTLTGDWNRLYLRVNVGYSLYYKNFKVYSI